VSDIVIIIGFVQSLFGVLIFLTKRPKHPSFAFLAIWMAVIAIYMGAALLPFEVVEYFKPGIFPIMFFSGPLLYFYVGSLAVENFKLRPRHLLHLIPFLFVAVHRSTIHGVPISSTPDLIENPNYLYNKIYYSLLLVSVFAYWLFGLKLIIRHRKKIPLYFSNYTNRNTLTWLICVQSLFLILFIASFLSFFITNVLGWGIIKYSMLTVNLTAFTFIMVYFGINQSAIYDREQTGFDVQEQKKYLEIFEPKHAGSTLQDEQAEELSSIVINYLKDEKPYRNPEYNLQMLADDLGITRHKLSHIINSSQKKNFFKFINEFRVSDVKEMLADTHYDHFSILGIALECGFNSKTSFNRIFKEETGFTPSEFKQAILSEAKQN